MKRQNKVMLFIAHQICPCSDDPACCQAPGQTEQEISDLVKALKDNKISNLEVYDIRDIRAADKYPAVRDLFKKYQYNALPIVIADGEIISYGIGDKDFIVNSIKTQRQEQR